MQKTFWRKLPRKIVFYSRFRGRKFSKVHLRKEKKNLSFLLDNKNLHKHTEDHSPIEENPNTILFFLYWGPKLIEEHFLKTILWRKFLMKPFPTLENQSEVVFPENNILSSVQKWQKNFCVTEENIHLPFLRWNKSNNKTFGKRSYITLLSISINIYLSIINKSEILFNFLNVDLPWFKAQNFTYYNLWLRTYVCKLLTMFSSVSNTRTLNHTFLSSTLSSNAVNFTLLFVSIKGT